MKDNIKKVKTNQSTKINLIGCDTIVNSPSSVLILKHKKKHGGDILLLLFLSSSLPEAQPGNKYKTLAQRRGN